MLPNRLQGGLAVLTTIRMVNGSDNAGVQIRKASPADAPIVAELGAVVQAIHHEHRPDWFNLQTPKALSDSMNSSFLTRPWWPMWPKTRPAFLWAMS